MTTAEVIRWYLVGIFVGLPALILVLTAFARLLDIVFALFTGGDR